MVKDSAPTMNSCMHLQPDIDNEELISLQAIVCMHMPYSSSMNGLVGMRNLKLLKSVRTLHVSAN